MTVTDFACLVAEHDLTNNPNRVVGGEQAKGILLGWAAGMKKKAEGMKKKHGK